IALSEGHTTAEGLDRDGKPVDIAQREWSYLNLYENDGHDSLRYCAYDRFDAFTSVKLKRDDLLRLWPRPSGSIRDETACKDWLVEQMRTSPLVRPKSKERFWIDDVKPRFPSLAKRQFVRAWAAAIADAPAPDRGRAGPTTKRTDRSTN